MISQIKDMFRGVGEWGLVTAITELASSVGVPGSTSHQVYTPPTDLTIAERALAQRSAELSSAVTRRGSCADDLKRKDRDVEAATEFLHRAKRARDEARKALDEATATVDIAREKHSEADGAFVKADGAERRASIQVAGGAVAIPTG
jgi:hypothetical protein